MAPIKDWDALIDRASAGDADAAREVLGEFVGSVEDLLNFKRPDLAWSGPIPLPVVRFLSDACRRILLGADPRVALQLVGKRGPEKGYAAHNATALAAAFTLLRWRGLGIEDATDALGEKLNVDRTTIQRARDANPAFEYWYRSRDGNIRSLIGEEVLQAEAGSYFRDIEAILKIRGTKAP